jgi:hypothetical protein
MSLFYLNREEREAVRYQKFDSNDEEQVKNEGFFSLRKGRETLLNKRRDDSISENLKIVNVVCNYLI